MIQSCPKSGTKRKHQLTYLPKRNFLIYSEQQMNEMFTNQQELLIDKMKKEEKTSDEIEKELENMRETHNLFVEFYFKTFSNIVSKFIKKTKTIQQKKKKIYICKQ